MTLPGRPTPDQQLDREMRARLRRAPLIRRLLARMGLQGKLVLCIGILLTITLSASFLLFISESQRMLTRASSDQAREVAHVLALASRGPLRSLDRPTLQEVADDLIDNDGIVGVAFHDLSGGLVAYASRDPGASGSCPAYLADIDHVRKLQADPHQLSTETFGTITRVAMPVVRPDATATASDNALAYSGYVTVCLALADHQQWSRVQWMLSAIGVAVLMLSLPAMYLIVYRIFLPIRQLVDATQRIAAGDLTVRVDIHRPDMIGTLARSFNDMLRHIKAHQDQLAQANRDLEGKVSDRTAQLEAANKRLSSEIAEKEAFLRAVSHDLNAPLRNIAGMTAMLLMKNREKFDSDTLDRLERINRNVKTETDLIAELLELSRIKTRRLKSEPVEMGALLSELREVFDNDLRTKQIELVIDTSMPVIYGERSRLRQIFLNLVDNAVKYMGDGPLREIHVGCAVGTDECEFYVRDTGVGIESADLEKVFYVFRRGKSPTVQAVAGKGVGLASVKSIVETYSGSIWAESEIGRGSTFRFTINGRFLTAGAIAPSPDDSMAGAK